MQVCNLLCVGAEDWKLCGSPVGSITLVLTKGNVCLYCATLSPPLWGKSNADHKYHGPTISALTLNYARATGKPPAALRSNKWHVVLEAQHVLNVDASFSAGEFTGSYGMVIHDSRGNFISA